jgi:hypothetical protein
MGKITCKDCPVRLYPACGENIPCCQCDREECNGRQPCPRKEENSLEYEEEILMFRRKTDD